MTRLPRRIEICRITSAHDSTGKMLPRVVRALRNWDAGPGCQCACDAIGDLTLRVPLRVARHHFFDAGVSSEAPPRSELEGGVRYQVNSRRTTRPGAAAGAELCHVCEASWRD